jgi:molybdenum cofactor cytidylyltransferase
VSDVVIVVGHEGPAVAAHLRRTRPAARVVTNPAYRTGQFSSVLAGLDAIDRPGVAAMLITLVDVPLVSSATVRAVLQRFQETSAPIVRPVRGEEHGHPVVIARSLFDQIRRADPETGLKPIVRANVSSAGDVPSLDPFAFRDVDTPAAHAELLGRLEE